MTSLSGPIVLAERVEAAHAGFDLRIPDNGPGIDGHFPGVPILAGVVQIDWAQRLSRHCFGISSPVMAITHLKFQRVMQPGRDVTLDLDYDARRGEIAFTFRCGGQSCSTGRLQLDRR